MTWFYDDDGMLVSQIRLEPEDAPLFKSALDAAMPAEAPKSVPAGTLSQRRADAFVAMVESFLTNGPGSRCGGERNMINLRLDAEALAGGQGFCEVDGVGVSAETAQRLSCDASVVLAIYGADGEPLDVGRRTRTWPTAIRRALELRDDCCVFPGCTNRNS